MSAFDAFRREAPDLFRNEWRALLPGARLEQYAKHYSPTRTNP